MSKEIEISEPSLKDRIVLQGKKIKDHVEENKWVYIGGVIVVLSRGYFKPKMAPTLNVADMVTHIRPVGILSKQDVTTNITKVYSPGRGRPGNLLVWLEDPILSTDLKPKLQESLECQTRRWHYIWMGKFLRWMSEATVTG